ncbi:MAG: cytidylyltransferase domain-containing protein [Nitrospinales bacterium]
MNTKLAAIIQARTGSTRLPAKTLRPLAGLPLVQHIIQRLQAASGIDQIVMAVPDSPAEEPLVSLARRLGIETVKGPEEDVLQRFIMAGDAVDAAHILRICSDNPLIDPNVVSALVKHHRDNLPDYTITSDPIPRGTEAEIARLDVLKHIAKKTEAMRYREHVTSYITDHGDQFRIGHAPAPQYLIGKTYRLTVDTEEDFLLMETLYDLFFDPDRPVIDLEQVIPYLDTHPETARLNANVKQKNWRLEK